MTASPPLSSSSASLVDYIDEEQLRNLTVTELNKRVHGCPRDEVIRLKQKRRTLKNRGYAQICRSKRLQQRQATQCVNEQLKLDLDAVKEELWRVTQECDHLRLCLRRSAFEAEAVSAAAMVMMGTSIGGVGDGGISGSGGGGGCSDGGEADAEGEGVEYVIMGVNDHQQLHQAEQQQMHQQVLQQLGGDNGYRM